jgi:hypothetical protein
MYGLTHLLHGVQAEYRRSAYVQDVVSTRIKYDPKNMHVYRGLITKTIQKPENKQTIYHIDDVVKVTTVSDNIREGAIKQLQSGKGASDVLGWSSVGTAMVGAGLLYADVQTAGLVSVSIGALGAIYGFSRSSQFDSELKKWKSRVPEYAEVRRSMPMKNYKFIHDNNYVKQFVLQEEARKLWKSDITKTKNELTRALSSAYKTRVDTMKSVGESTPLDPKFIIHFESTDDLQQTQELGHKVRDLMLAQDKLTVTYNSNRDQMIRARDCDIVISNSSFNIAQNAVQTVQTIDAVVDANERNNQINQYGPHGPNGPNNQNVYAKRLAKNIGFFGASATVESLRANEESKIRQKYDQQLASLQSNYELCLIDMLPTVTNLYDQHEQLQLKAKL